MNKYICIFEDYVGVGKTIIEAYDNLKAVGESVDVDECQFYAAKEIKVEVEIRMVEEKTIVHY